MSEAFNTAYAGFWRRFGAHLIDSLLFMMIIVPLLLWVHGPVHFGAEAPTVPGLLDIILQWVFPAVAVIAFWHYRQATPGKMVMSVRVVDARTGGKPSLGQLIGRYFAYLVSILPLLLGFLWVAIDKRKQGWHDKLAGTLVVRTRG